jgi:hypothetical protein
MKMIVRSCVTCSLQGKMMNGVGVDEALEK